MALIYGCDPNSFLLSNEVFQSTFFLKSGISYTPGAKDTTNPQSREIDLG